MDPITLLRIVLPFIGVGVFAIFARLLRPPRHILVLTLKVCWLIGVMNVIADVVGTRFGFWHFTMDHLVFDLPPDLYVTISLAYGGAFLLTYWWLRERHRPWAVPFALILPFYGLFRDFFGQRMTGDSMLVWDSPHWWIADFASWAIGLWATMFVFHRAIVAKDPHSR